MDELGFDKYDINGVSDKDLGLLSIEEASDLINDLKEELNYLKRNI